MINVDAIILLSDSRDKTYENKLLVDDERKLIIENLINEVVKANCFKNIVVVYQKEEVQNILDKYDVIGIYNLKHRFGKSEAVKLGLEVLGESQGTMIFSEEYPVISYLSILKIWENFIQNPDKIVVPYIDANIRNPIIFPKDLYRNFNDLENDQGEMEILKLNIKLIEIVNIKSNKIFF